MYTITAHGMNSTSKVIKCNETRLRTRQTYGESNNITQAASFSHNMRCSCNNSQMRGPKLHFWKQIELWKSALLLSLNFRSCHWSFNVCSNHGNDMANCRSSENYFTSISSSSPWSWTYIVELEILFLVLFVRPSQELVLIWRWKSILTFLSMRFDSILAADRIW